jgi:hypothetical protein
VTVSSARGGARWTVRERHATRASEKSALIL